jgi:predicted nucleic acid-binding protein
MMRYLLDTDVLIDYSKGVGAVVSQVQAWERDGDDLGICRVQVAEFISGVRLDDRSAGGTFLSAFRRWSITELAAIQAGVYRYDFARISVQIATPDAIIAGVARTTSATLVTRKVRDFPMTDIRILTI